MSQAPASRFEFRVFAPPGGLESSRERLRHQMEAEGREVQDELYLIGSRPDRNVKLRDGAIDIKALRETRAGLERWEPVERRELPVPGPWVVECLARELGLERLEAPRACYGQDALLDEVVARAPGLRAVRVRKRRERFRGEGALAEFARVDGPEPLETLAIESEDPERVQAWVSRLGLEGRPNTSYVEQLRRSAAAQR